MSEREGASAHAWGRVRERESATARTSASMMLMMMMITELYSQNSIRPSLRARSKKGALAISPSILVVSKDD